MTLGKITIAEASDKTPGDPHWELDHRRSTVRFRVERVSSMGFGGPISGLRRPISPSTENRHKSGFRAILISGSFA